MQAPDIAALFADVVAQHPDRLAVAEAGRRLTYGQLDDETERLAARLADDDGPVGLAVAHGVPLAVGLMAVLRRGRVAVPIDPSMPVARRDRVLDDAGAGTLVTDAGVAPWPGAPRPLAHPQVVAPDRIAMLLYTSGSTGAPKGVVYTHDRIIERIVRRDRFDIGPGDRIGVFGAAGMNLFRALLTGGALVAWDMARDGVAGVADWIAREEITLLHGIPTLFRRLADALPAGRAFPALRRVSVTGEPLLRHDVLVLRRLFPPPCVLMNGLGTTEAGTFCQWTIDDAFDGAIAPVGVAVEGTEVLVLDDGGTPMPPGDVGEIAVRGPLLAAGYWRLPELEARRFRGHPRTYLTGDLGRLLPDGVLVHLGRGDQQLKIRGVRVEAAEVEQGLLAHPAVRDVAVMGQSDGADGTRLVACVAVDDRRPGLAHALRRFARERLPDAMVPDGWSFVDALPRTPNGKVDRRALPMPPPRPAPPGIGIVDRFVRQVALRGDAPAVRDGDTVTTFAELDARSAALAARLRAGGVRRDTVVAIALERSASSLVCVLGVLRAGGACLPLDPGGPRQRNEAMLHESGTRWLLARDPGLDADVVRIDPATTVPSAPPPLDVYDPDRLAFVLYTSGSTGRPKGVELREGQVLHRLAWDWSVRPAVPGEVACQRGATGFVDSLAEWLGPLLEGVPLDVVPDELLRRPHALVDHLGRAGVTRILLVPSQLDLLLDTVDDLGERLPLLRCWTASGESLRASTVARFRRALPDAALWNVYGATEAWDATCHRITGDDDVVPIGEPLPGMRAYVLDDALAPVPVGAAGELYVAGDGLARGYRGDDDLTRARFVPNPFAPGSGDRLYRTGDRVRWRDDGVLEHLGRADRQVQVRGVRVELGEVESALAAHPAVADAAVVARDGRIVAYVAGRVERAALRLALRERLLPAAMPADIVVLPALPRNERGKLDRVALAGHAPGVAEPHPASATPTELELTVMQVFADLLRRPVGVDDDFFDAGGDSLLAIRLVAELEALTGRTLPLDAIAVAPTSRGVADAVTRGGFAWTTADCISQHVDGGAPPLFGICGAWGYAVRLLRLGRALGDDFPLHALQPPGMTWPDDVDLHGIGRHYADEILRLRPAGPFHLIGTSFGGVIAFEVAVQLEARGHEVALLAMVDSALPGARLRAVPDADEQTLSEIERAGRRVYMAHRRAVADYRPTATLLGRVVYFLCTDLAHESHVGWQRLVRQPIDVVPVPGSHGAFHVEPQLGVIARDLRERLRPPSLLRRLLRRAGARE